MRSDHPIRMDGQGVDTVAAATVLAVALLIGVAYFAAGESQRAAVGRGTDGLRGVVPVEGPDDGAVATSGGGSTTRPAHPRFYPEGR